MGDYMAGRPEIKYNAEINHPKVMSEGNNNVFYRRKTISGVAVSHAVEPLQLASNTGLRAMRGERRLLQSNGNPNHQNRIPGNAPGFHHRQHRYRILRSRIHDVYCVRTLTYTVVGTRICRLP